MADILTASIELGRMLGGGIVAAANSKSNFESKKSQLTYERDQAQAQLDALLTEYNNSLAGLELDLSQSLSEYNSGIWATERAQATGLATAATLGTANNAEQYAQLAELNRNNRQAVGAAVQSVATSGFRATGSGGNIIRDTQRRADESYRRAATSARLSAYSSYMDAANNYFSANVQLEDYRRGMRDAKASYEQNLKTLESNKDAQQNILQGQISYYQGQIEGMGEWDFWDGVRDFFGGMF